MSWRPDLVALDIDGTLVDHDGRLPSDVIDAVGRVLAADVPVVLATGRSWHETQPIVNKLGLPTGSTVCSNGAVTVAYPPQEIVTAITFDPRDVITQVRALSPTTLIAVEEIGRGFRLSDHFPAGDLSGEMIIEDVEDLKARPVTRVILRDPDARDEDFIALAEQLGLHGCTYYIGWSLWLDIAPEGVNKATALAEIAAQAGIPVDRVLAIGDGSNDVEMLGWAGRGVAMGDARDLVKAAADHVTARFADGGTAAELNRWFG